MRADLFAVYKHGCFVIDGAEMQEQHARKVAFGKRELAAVADSRNKIGMSKAGELAFRAERNVNFKRKLLVVVRHVLQTALKRALAEIEVKFPFAVQVGPMGAFPLRQRILGTRNRNVCHFS